MPDIYKARKRLKVGDRLVMPGEDIPEAITWRNLHSYIASGAVVLVQTTVDQAYPYEQQIPLRGRLNWRNAHNVHNRYQIVWGHGTTVPPVPGTPDLALGFPANVDVPNKGALVQFGTTLTNANAETADGYTGRWEITVAPGGMLAADLVVNMVDFDGPGSDVLIDFADASGLIVGTYGPFPITANMRRDIVNQISVQSDAITADTSFAVVAKVLDDAGVEAVSTPWTLNVTTTAPPVPILTSVTPSTVKEDAPSTFTVLGQNLAGIDAAALSGQADVPLSIVGLSDTGFTFDATLVEPGDYDLYVSTAGTENDRLSPGIRVTNAVPTLIAVTPNPPAANIDTEFGVGGTNLLSADGLYLTPSAGGANIALSIDSQTDTLLKFTHNFPGPGIFDMTVTENGADADNLQDAITVVALFNTIFLTVSPDIVAADSVVAINGTYSGPDPYKIRIYAVGSGFGTGVEQDIPAGSGGAFTVTMDFTGEPPGEYLATLHPYSGGPMSNDLPFTITDAITTAETITSIAPDELRI